MYLKKITLKNIKCFSHLEIDFFTPDNQPRLWTAILGQNALGKSTLLQAVGAALAGPWAMRELLPVAEGWVRTGQSFGEIEAQLLWSEGDALTPHWPKQKTPYIVHYLITGDNPTHLPPSFVEQHTAVPDNTLSEWSGEGTQKEREQATKDLNRLKLTAYAEGKSGWFACGYGPFRRLSGGAQAADRIVYSGRKSARFVTLFREDAALTNATEWLISLYNTARDGDEASKRALEQIKEAFARELLPEPAQLQVNSHSALLKIKDQSPVPFQSLSDGYRSMLAFGIDLLRWMTLAFPESGDLMSNSGIVLIDELDAHAHPAWQREVGHWLRQKFPQLQFIVATHSPFLAQVADAPDGNIILEQRPEGVGVRNDVESVEAWRADQILTDLFDLPTTRSPEVERKIERLQSLRQRSRIQKLTAEQEQEYKQLDLWSQQLPPAIEDPEERSMAESLQMAVDKQSDRIRELK
jgi:hypothetical protein